MSFYGHLEGDRLTIWNSGGELNDRLVPESLAIHAGEYGHPEYHQTNVKPATSRLSSRHVEAKRNDENK